MQDRYVGDIGDFGKYGLLRHLCGVKGFPINNPLRLGVVWYRNKPVENNDKQNDGKHTKYLDDSDPKNSVYKKQDSDLYKALKCLVKGEKRNVIAVKEAGLLSANTQYYECFVTKQNRKDWFTAALEATSESSLIFVDPDNGIQLDNKSPKHVSVEELRRFANEGQSLVIYQENIRTINWWIECFAEKLKKELTVTGKGKPAVWVLQWHLIRGRSYFIIGQPDHNEFLGTRITEFLNSNWGQKIPRSKPPFTLEYYTGDNT